jgi:hypothetical protein
MGFGQKPIFAIGVIDMRDNLLNYTKKWDGTERTDGNTTPYTFYNNYSSDGFFRNFRISDVIFPPEYTTWTTNSFGQGCFGNNYWITNTQSLLTPTGFNNAVGEKFSGIDGQWSNLYLHVPSTLLSQYETTWASIIANAKSLTIIGDADSVI